MPCLLAVLGFFTPRLVLFILWLVGWTQGAFATVIWPVLGFVFMPFTTLAYAFGMKSNGSISGLYLALVIVGVLSSAVSLYYYLRVVVYMYMKPEGEGAEAPRLGFNSALVVFACALFTLALGLLPAKYLSLSYQSIHSLLR